MQYDIIDHSVMDSDGSQFEAKIKFNYTDSFNTVHPGELVVFNCPWDKSLLKKSELRIRYIELTEDNARFEEETMEEDLGYEQIDYLKGQIESFLKKTLKH